MQIVVRPDDGIVLGVDPVLLVEQGMMTGDAGLPAHLVVGTAEAPGVGKLETNEKIVGGAEAFGMGIVESGEKLPKAVLVFGGGQSLVRVGPAVGLYGGGLTAPDELGPAEPEVAPATDGVLGGRTVAVGVPSLHGVNAPAVAHGYAAHFDGLSQRGTGGGGESLVVYGKFETELFQTTAKGGNVLEACNLYVVMDSYSCVDEKQ